MIVIRTPAHKQTDPAKAPGQTLGEYIAAKYPELPRMSFNDWFHEYTLKHGLPPAYIAAQAAWNASRENL
jgi:hypothetical protein